MDLIETHIDSKLEKLSRKADVLDAIRGRIENMTALEIGLAINQQLKFDKKKVAVINQATGEPIEGATVAVYSDWYAYNSNNGSDFLLTTDSNGETGQVNFERDSYYYYSVSYPGFLSNTSDNFYDNENYG